MKIRNLFTLLFACLCVGAYAQDGGVGISARSLGDINVQLIMEYLGGGGHSTVAGAQVKDKNVDMVIEDVEKAVFDYVANNES